MAVKFIDESDWASDDDDTRVLIIGGDATEGWWWWLEALLMSIMVMMMNCCYDDGGGQWRWEGWPWLVLMIMVIDSIGVYRGGDGGGVTTLPAGLGLGQRAHPVRPRSSTGDLQDITVSATLRWSPTPFLRGESPGPRPRRAGAVCDLFSSC